MLIAKLLPSWWAIQAKKLWPCIFACCLLLHLIQLLEILFIQRTVEIIISCLTARSNNYGGVSLIINEWKYLWVAWTFLFWQCRISSWGNIAWHCHHTAFHTRMSVIKEKINTFAIACSKLDKHLQCLWECAKVLSKCSQEVIFGRRHNTKCSSSLTRSKKPKALVQSISCSAVNIIQL